MPAKAGWRRGTWEGHERSVCATPNCESPCGSSRVDEDQELCHAAWSLAAAAAKGTLVFGSRCG